MTGPNLFPSLCAPLVLLLGIPPAGQAEGWHNAEPGWTYHYPRDEFSHPDFKTEWWYFTGNLSETSSGRRFGYQLTFFRQGIRPPGQRESAASRFVVDHFWFAHFALTDIDGKRFHHTERISRGAFGEAGSGGERIAWLGDWELRGTANGPGHYAVEAAAEDFALSLAMTPSKPLVLQGDQGYSPKSADPGNASHYYSFTRLVSRGTIRLDGRRFEVEGSSWFDREWSTSLLGKHQAGWDWFAIQLDDGRDLMLFQLRQQDGGADFLSGTLVGPDGATRTLGAEDFTLTPAAHWQSPKTGAQYPVEWKVDVPGDDLSLRIRPTLREQELNLAALSYWEGATRIEGTGGGTRVSGRGYLELTGYGFGTTRIAGGARAVRVTFQCSLSP